MKTFIKKYYNKQQITQEELFTFIVEYCKLFPDVKEPNTEELQLMLMLIQQGAFNLQYAVEVASKKIGMNITIVYDKSGQVVKVTILE